MNREKMIWILLLVGLTSSVCGMFVLKKTPTFYQAEEDDNITIGWDSPIMSLTILSCFFQSEPLKLFYEMVDGVESSESQHQQFAGRVQCDKGALRGGRVRLHVSRVTTDDSGRYWCDLAANYDKIRRRWRLETTDPNHTAKGPKKENKSDYWDNVKRGIGAANVGLVIFGSIILAALNFPSSIVWNVIYKQDSAS